MILNQHIQSSVQTCYTTFDGSNENVNANGVVSSVSANTTGSWSCWVKPVDADDLNWDLESITPVS